MKKEDKRLKKLDALIKHTFIIALFK